MSGELANLDAYRDVQEVACHFCGAPVAFRITERATFESLDVCPRHKWTAFS